MEDIHNVTLEQTSRPEDLVKETKQRLAQFTNAETDVINSNPTSYVRSQATLGSKDSIEFSAAMKCFLFKGTNGAVTVVKFTPKPTCSCRPVGTCYHIAAVRKSIGFIKTSVRRVANLTKLRKNKRTVKQKPGKKIPRVGDSDVAAAPDAAVLSSEDEVDIRIKND
jgi:hypothetical protein